MFGGLDFLPPCTYDHLPAIIILDAAVELAKVLWLPERRSKGTVAGQADFIGRVYPALLQRLQKVVGSCERGSDGCSLKRSYGHLRQVGGSR